MTQADLPVFWARSELICRFISRFVQPVGPPVLVLSLPRSGSSWVGDILGCSENALYLREPLTQTYLSHGGRFAVHAPGQQNDKFSFYENADTAFNAIPRFNGGIVRNAGQWSLFSRRSKRLVIKEVNPLAIDWLLHKYQPRIVYLVRHPAAVALSWQKLGWINTVEELKNAISGLKPDTLHDWHDLIDSANDFWAAQGVLQAISCRQVLNALTGYRDVCICHYEEICLNPLDMFKKIFDFCELAWNTAARSLVELKSSGGNQAQSYQTSRNSRQMIDAWRGQVAAEDLDRLGNYYRAFNLPFYQNSKDW